MKTRVMCVLAIAVGLLLTGCPEQQVDLVGTHWHVDVSNANEGDVTQCAGTWVFNDDGTIEIKSQLEGTYTFDGSSIEFQAEYLDSEDYTDYSESDDEVEYTYTNQYTISGTLVYDGNSLYGTGQYAIIRTDTNPDGINTSEEGDCTISGDPPLSFGELLGVLFVLTLPASLLMGLLNLLNVLPALLVSIFSG